MKFAKVVFWIAGIYGILAITPLYFLFNRIGQQDPPPITHPGFYYGFAGVALAWQIAFFVIATDPVRLRPIMIPSVLEKLGFGDRGCRAVSATACTPWRTGPWRRGFAVRTAVPDRVH